MLQTRKGWQIVHTNEQTQTWTNSQVCGTSKVGSASHKDELSSCTISRNNLRYFYDLWFLSSHKIITKIHFRCIEIIRECICKILSKSISQGIWSQSLKVILLRLQYRHKMICWFTSRVPISNSTFHPRTNGRLIEAMGDVSSQNLDPLIVFGTELVLNDDNCRPDEHKDLMTNEAITGDKETLVKSSNTKLYMLHYSKHFGYNYGSTADWRTRLLARLDTEKSQATSTLARGAI